MLKPTSQVKAYIMGNGQIVKQEDIPKVAHNSEQITDGDVFRSLLDGGKIYRPAIALAQLVDLLYTNFLHFRCINQKVSDVVGRGYVITSGNSETDTANKDDIETITSFFSRPNTLETGAELLKKVWTDYESLAQVYLELSLDGEGKPVALWVAPAQTVRICVGKNYYVQIIDNKKKYFPKFGATADVLLRDKVALGIRETDISQHCMFSLHNSSPKDLNYGVPDYFPVVPAILLDKYRSDFNISYFENNAVPRYAVIVTGASIEGPVEEAIKSYFSTHIKGQAHKTLILSVGDKEVNITFEKLAADVQESSFRLLHQDALYDICLAHMIPPRWVGIAERGSLGGSKESESQARNYKTNYVVPNQQLLSDKLTEILIREGFKNDKLKIRFNDLDITDVLADAKVGETYVKNGILSINEFRTSYLRLPKLETPSADKHTIYSKGKAIMLEDWDTKTELEREKLLMEKEETDLFKHFSNRIGNGFEKSLKELKEELVKAEEKQRIEGRSMFEKMFHFFKSMGKQK